MYRYTMRTRNNTHTQSDRAFLLPRPPPNEQLECIREQHSDRREEFAWSTANFAAPTRNYYKAELGRAREVAAGP